MVWRTCTYVALGFGNVINIRGLLSSMHACVCIYALLMYACAKAQRVYSQNHKFF